MIRTQMKLQITILALILLLTGCGNGAGEKNGKNGNGKSIPVYAEELKPATFRHYVKILGTVESDNTIMITPKVGATVEQVLVQIGDEVRKGDVLARLDGKITRSQLNQAKTQLELAETMYKRQKNLREDNIGSEVNYLQAQTQYESAKSQLVMLKEQYENYTIRATIKGTVNQVNIKAGATAAPSVPAFQLANSDALKVTAQISESYITRIQPGDSVEIVFPSLNESIQKKLDVVSKVINPSNRTIGVEIYIPNTSGNVRPNMMAQVNINDIALDDQIVVPVNTVQRANKLSYVFVAEQNGDGWVARNREVKVGYYYANNQVITDGLEAGELLITSGYSNLSNGAAISIQEN